MNPYVSTLSRSKASQRRFRSTIYRCRFFVCSLFLVLTLLVSRAACAATIYTVTDTSDNASDTGSLRYAVNVSTGGDSIVFASGVIGTISLTGGTLTINHNLTIIGPGAALLTISGSGNGNAVAFNISSGTVNISSMAIVNNTVVGSGGYVGSAIYNRGTLTLSNCSIANNTAGDGGGAIGNQGTLTVDNCSISGNKASANNGGGIENQGVLTVENSTISDNTTSNSGGGIFNEGTLTVENSTISGNAATSGGGIYNQVGLFRATLTVENSTISGNTATSSDGGIGNNGSTLTLTNSIVAGNAGGDCQTCGTPSNNMIGGTPDLGPLQYNDGITETMMPLPGSGAIGAGLSSTLTTDQRGFARPTSGASDLGAVQTNYLTVNTLNDSSDTTTCTGGATCSLRDAITLANSDGSGDIVFQSGLTGTITLASVLPSIIASQVNLVGPGANLLTIDGGSNHAELDIPRTNTMVKLSGMTIANGFSSTYAGGLTNSGFLMMENIAFSGNGGGNGGAIFNDGIVIGENSTFSNNYATDGAGIANTGILLVYNGTFFGNRAYNANGGGLENNGGVVLVADSTIFGNYSLKGGIGGGISIDSGTLMLTNSIVAGNTNLNGHTEDDCNNCGTQSSFNLIGGISNPNLGPLTYNGLNASVQTMLPLPGSPAIQAGDPALLPLLLNTDGRGFPRLTGGKLDLGAAQTNYTSVQFVQQPTNTLINANIDPAVTVEVLEANPNLAAPNNTDAVSGIPITLTFSGSGTVGGTLTQTATAGVATFGDLKVNAAGTGNTLSTSLAVTSAQTLTATSSAFDITLLTPTVSFSPVLPTSVTYGVAPITLGATATSSGTSTGQTISYQVDSGPATISGNVLSITGAGTVVLEADAAVNGNYSAADTIANIAVSQVALTVTASNATRVYGVANPAFTGTYTGAVNGDTFTESFTTAATQASHVSTYSITPVVMGANLANYSMVANNGNLIVTQAASRLALTASANQAAPRAPLTLTATATSATTGIPGGTVVFLDNNTQLGTATLNAQGVATLTTTTLPTGSHSITANYAGDTNFIGSQTQLAGTIAIGIPTFTMTGSTSNMAVQRGQVGIVTLTLTPLYGYTGTINFGCNNLPEKSLCSFQPSSITFDGSGKPVQVPLVIEIGELGLAKKSTVARLEGLHPLRNLPVLPAMIFWLPKAELAFDASERKKRRRAKKKSGKMLWMIALLAITTGVLGLTGCAGMRPNYNVPPAGQQTITITAAGSGNISQSVAVQVNVL